MTWVFGLLLKLVTWGRANPMKALKWGLVLGGGLVIFLLWKWDRNSVWESGLDEGVKRGEKQTREFYEEKWKVLQKGIDADREKLAKGMAEYATRTKVLDAREQEIFRARKTIDDALTRAVAVAEAGIAAGYLAGSDLTDATADDAISGLSIQLEQDAARRKAAGAPVPK